MRRVLSLLFVVLILSCVSCEDTEKKEKPKTDEVIRHSTGAGVLD